MPALSNTCCLLLYPAILFPGRVSDAEGGRCSSAFLELHMKPRSKSDSMLRSEKPVFKQQYYYYNVFFPYSRLVLKPQYMRCRP